MFAPPGNVAACFQPLVSLGARRIIGFTAHSIRPGDEILRAACRAATHWPDGITLGVELSPERWRHPAVGLQIFSALSESGLSPTRIELEIAEDALLRDTHVVLQTIERVRHSGPHGRAHRVRPRFRNCGAGIQLFDTIKFGQTLVQRLNAS